PRSPYVRIRNPRIIARTATTAVTFNSLSHKHLCSVFHAHAATMSDTVFARLSALLNAKSIPFEILCHAPVFTSEEAAAVRGTPLASGAKALICRADEQFFMIVLPADRKLASKAVRKAGGIKSLRFASREEVEQLTGLQPGSIPPFGNLFGLPTWCDERLAE